MLSDERRSFCIGVNRDYDVLLRSVLNKSVNSLTRAEVVSITNKYINLGTQKFSLVRLAYQYPPGHCADLPVRCRRDRLHQAGVA